MASDRPPRFRIRVNPPLERRTWNDHSVLFDPASGDTHLLDAVAREGIVCLEATALDVSELVDAMAHRLDVPPDAELRRYVEQLLALFDDLGIVEVFAGSEA